MTVQEYLELFESPYADAVYNELVRYCGADPLADALMKIPQNANTPQEVYDELVDIAENIQHSHNYRIVRAAQNMAIALSADGGVFPNDVYDGRRDNTYGYLLRTGLPAPGVLYKNGLSKAQDYANLLKLDPDITWGRSDRCPSLARSTESSAKTIDEIRALEYFYFLPQSSKLLTGTKATRIYKCKEYPELLFVKWGRQVSLNEQNAFLDYIERVTNSNQRDALEWAILKETRRDDFEGAK